MRGEPCLDIAATLRRQFVVDVGVQLVFGDGNLWIAHGRCLCLIKLKIACRPVAISLPARRKDRKTVAAQTRSSHPHPYACHHLTRRRTGRSPWSEALTWARARARRDITVPI